MLALINLFQFDINDTDFDKIERTISAKWARHSRLNNHDTFQDVGKYEEHIVISGVLIAKSQSQLLAFEKLVKDKEKCALTLPNGTTETIIINKIHTKKSEFLVDGEFLRQEYTIDIDVVEEGDGFGFLDGIGFFGFFGSLF